MLGKLPQLGEQYGLELLKKGVIYRVSNGESIRIWRDNWIPRTGSMRPSGSRRVCRLRRVCHLIDTTTRRWDEALVRRVFFHPWDVVEILKIKLPTFGTEDVIAWQPHKSGLFSVRSTNRLAMEVEHGLGNTGSSSAPSGERAVWKKLWKLEIPPKVRVFVWKAINNGLPIIANRSYRHLDKSSTCDICASKLEDVFHALIECPHARGLRMAMVDSWQLPVEVDIENHGLEWFMMMLDNQPPKVMKNFIMVLWRAWHVRNSITQARKWTPIEGSVVFLSAYLTNLSDC